MNSEGRDSTTLGALAELVGGRVSGDPSTCLCGVAPLGAAGAREITFLANPKQHERLHDCQASAVIVHPSLEGVIDLPLLLVENTYLAFAKILKHFRVAEHVAQGISPAADVHPEARVAEDVTISAGCVVGPGAVVGRGSCLHPNVVLYPNAVVGEDCLIHANVTIREECIVGDRVILQPGAVIGSDGFGYAPDGERYFKIPQIGRAILEDDVEIGASVCVDRGTLGDTRVARGTKIDNLVQIAHNGQVGENCIILPQTGLAGSVKIGKHCTISGHVAVTDHVTIGDHVTIAGKSGVTNDVEGNQVVAGFPVQPHREWLRAHMTIPQLPEMRREIQRLKKQVNALTNQMKKDDE